MQPDSYKLSNKFMGYYIISYLLHLSDIIHMIQAIDEKTVK